MALSRGMVIRGFEPRVDNHGTKKGRGVKPLSKLCEDTLLGLTSRVSIPLISFSRHSLTLFNRRGIVPLLCRDAPVGVVRLQP